MPRRNFCNLNFWGLCLLDVHTWNFFLRHLGIIIHCPKRFKWCAHIRHRRRRHRSNPILVTLPEKDCFVEGCVFAPISCFPIWLYFGSFTFLQQFVNSSRKNDNLSASHYKLKNPCLWRVRQQGGLHVVQFQTIIFSNLSTLYLVINLVDQNSRGAHKWIDTSSRLRLPPNDFFYEHLSWLLQYFPPFCSAFLFYIFLSLLAFTWNTHFVPFPTFSWTSFCPFLLEKTF